MTTRTKFFTFRMTVHLFNGYAIDVEGVGIARTEDGKVLTEETILATISLGNLLRRIVITNGYTITNGKLVKLEVLPKTLEHKI